METQGKKLYHVHGMDSKGFLQTYFSKGGEDMFGDETINFQLKKLHDLLAAGNFKGKSAYDFSISAIIHQLFTIADCYQEITILKLNESCILELKKWLNTRTGAFDWAHAHDYAKGLEGSRDQAEMNKEEKLKSCIKDVIPFDFKANNLTGPVVLKQADCIITAWLLDVTCQDQNEYVQNFQKITKYLKPGGLLIYIGCLHATFYKVGNDTHHVFTYNESFLRQNLANEGFKIETCEVLDRKVQSDLTDYEKLIFVTAIKKSA